jgi:putative addiction module component (TIGR02574 family)
MTIEQLKAQALKLPHHERAALARELLESLDKDSEIEQAWYDEAERRLLELEEGSADAYTLEEVLEGARARPRG